MMRWLVLWNLRRRRDSLSDRVDWIRDCVWSAQVALGEAEAKLREAQARLWCGLASPSSYFNSCNVIALKGKP